MRFNHGSFGLERGHERLKVGQRDSVPVAEENQIHAIGGSALKTPGQARKAILHERIRGHYYLVPVLSYYSQRGSSLQVNGRNTRDRARCHGAFYTSQVDLKNPLQEAPPRGPCSTAATEKGTQGGYARGWRF